MATIPLINVEQESLLADRTQSDKQKWDIIPVSKMPTVSSQRLAMRLNAFGSSYYFAKVILRRHRLNDNLHYDMCSLLEKTHIKDIIEIPRDHFKSTIYSFMAPMWWALPFNDSDEAAMRRLGYGDAFIVWMRLAHNRDTRTLLVSEVIENAIKLGTRIGNEYLNNELFRDLFPEVLPDTTCIWTAKSLHHKRSKNSPNGEGTYDFLGVGGALQSRHYDRLVQDDLVGRSAIDSEKSMEDVINYHRLLPGAFDSIPGQPTVDNDELVVGNRWSYRDLNDWIKRTEPWFNVTTHSAVGGCCTKHPVGKVIFPEEWSIEKLEKTQIRYGAYYYSCQYLNNPVPEGSSEFQQSWLRYYNFVSVSEIDKRALIQHETYEGEVIDNLLPSELQISMVVDPAHAQNTGRSRHAITITGVQAAKIIKHKDGTSSQNPQRIYLLDCWAEKCDYHTFVAKIYELATRWKLRDFWLETVMAQRYLKFYLDYRNKVENIKLKVNELRPDNSANAKDNRIRALNPIFAEGNFWCRRVPHANFILEYTQFPYGATKDIIDTVAYAPQTWSGRASNKEVLEFIQGYKNRIQHSRRAGSVTGY